MLDFMLIKFHFAKKRKKKLKQYCKKEKRENYLKVWQVLGSMSLLNYSILFSH